jgi:hypothetical protein
MELLELELEEDEVLLVLLAMLLTNTHFLVAQY